MFIFTLNDGSRIVARLPFKFAGPSRLTTASEVATIKYCMCKPNRPEDSDLANDICATVQRNTSIPIPKILDWSDDAANDIGSECIIMEHATGTPLHQKWLSMSGDQKVICIDAIYKKLREMVDITFPGYGSIYFSTEPLDSHSKIPLDGSFCLGPHCGTRYWDCGDRRYYQRTPPNQGPCEYLLTLENIAAKTVNVGRAISDFADGLIDTGLSRIPPKDSDLPTRPSYQGSVPTQLELLKNGRQVLHAMSTDSRVHDAASPTLFHPDLHKRNIFVSDTDPSVITAIIDWQSCSIEPAFWYADEVPDFAIHAPSPTSSTEKVDDSELCAKVYEAATQFLTPKLALPKSMNESIFRPFRYCYRTWKDGAVAFQHELIETSQEWKTLGFTGACPFVLPTPKEMALHQKEYRYFEAAQNLKRDLSNLLDCATDGWVPPGNWEAAKRGNEAMFEGMLQAVLTNQDPDDDEPIREEKDLREIWPFDVPRK